MKGIGYQAYSEFRTENEHDNICREHQEKPGNERYVIYFGRAYCKDYETGKIARGPMKIGRAKFASAVMRGRNQAGVDFRVHAEIVFDSNKATHDCEKIVKDALSHRNVIGSQGQIELYDISDRELKKTVETIVSIFKSEEISHNILEVVFFSTDKRYERNVHNEMRKRKQENTLIDFLS